MREVARVEPYLSISRKVGRIWQNQTL